MYRGKLVAKRARPVVEHVRDRRIVDDGEGQIQIREAVATALHSHRAHSGSGHDARIRLRQPEQPITHGIALRDSEHEACSFPCDEDSTSAGFAGQSLASRTIAAVLPIARGPPTPPRVR